jgi:GT2 family glycosyltransferase
LLHHGLSVDDRIRLGVAARRAAARMPMPESLRARLMLGRNAEAGAVLRPLDLLPTDDEVSQFPDTLASQQAGMADVFVWSVIDWHFRTQRPQHLARALAGKGHRVFYLSNNLVDAQEPGYSLDPLDEERRLFQVHLNVSKAPSIYHGLPTPRQAAQLRASLAALLGWTRTRKSISLVQHPFWSGPAQCLPNAHVVYDCMDHHAGFENNASSILAAETDLIEGADLVIASSAWLRDELSSRNEKVALIRNGTDHEHFRTAPAAVFRDEQGRQVIGYYGAIAEWFDTGLVRRVAQDHPEALVLLIGSDTAGAALSLGDLPNVHFTGEVAYRDLPYWVHGFDLCLLPFRVLPLTLATNPVKVYEYLSAGKPVVAVDLPEMGQFDAIVTVAADPSAFSAAVGRVLAGPRDPAAMAARQNFAAEQTWDHRASAFDRAIKAIVEPTVSVIVLTYNNVALTKACLLSLECNSDYPGLEVIVVDNASNDGSQEFLRKWQRSGSRRKLILNDSNLGFATGNNQGLEAAVGDVLVMLNNDTYVTPGWVRTLLWHLRRDPVVGLVGPVTNNIGNEAKIEINYGDMREMIAESAHYTLAHAGRSLPLEAIAFFCVMMRRQVYERVGGLDESFGIGFFEDDDYCRRVTECGWKIVCAEDVFVHHHLSASFGAMEDTLRQELFLRNKAIYEAKWGAWVPHAYRSKG